MNFIIKSLDVFEGGTLRIIAEDESGSRIILNEPIRLIEGSAESVPYTEGEVIEVTISKKGSK